jgi:hypothetical protein
MNETPTVLNGEDKGMGYILMEAFLAGSILVLIVWWTMFHGRDRGEKKQDVAPKDQDQS